MPPTTQAKAVTASSPPSARFLLRLVPAYGAWVLLAHTVLGPEAAFVQALCRLLAGAGAALLVGVGLPAWHAGPLLGVGTLPLQVVPGCDGLALYALFAGFVLAYPGRRRLAFLGVGLVVLGALNVARLAGLAALLAYFPAAFAGMHTAGQYVLLYGAVAGLWLLWVRLPQPALLSS